MLRFHSFLIYLISICQTCGRGTSCDGMLNFQTPSKKFKGDSRYTGSEDEDDYSDFTMNKGFIQYSILDDCNDK